MSNVFIKSDLNGIFDSATDSITMPKLIKIVNKEKKTTEENKKNINSSNNLLGGNNNKILKKKVIDHDNFSSTSSNIADMHGGNYNFSNTSSNINSRGENDDFSNTSSNIADMHGGNNNFSNTSSDIYGENNNFSNTSSNIADMHGGNNNFSNTSSNIADMRGGNNNFSNTSSDNYGGNNNFSNTSSNIADMHGGNYDFSNTSSNIADIHGGNQFSNTSSNINIIKNKNKNKLNISNYDTDNAKSMHQDIQKLIAMLTSDESESHSSNTNAMEDQLRNLLNKQSVGKNLHGGSNMDVDYVKNFFTNLKKDGVDVNVKLNDRTMSDFFQLAGYTTTDKLDDNELKNINLDDLSPTSTSVMLGGAKKKVKSKENIKQAGGINPGFQAFLDLKKFVAEKLKISNGPKAGKIAGVIQKDVKAKNENLTEASEILKKSKDHFEKNMNHYKELL
jgi:hypothetical protein